MMAATGFRNMPQTPPMSKYSRDFSFLKSVEFAKPTKLGKFDAV